MWELDNEEGWALKTRCFWTVVLEKTLESPLDSKEIQPVNPKGNQPWIVTGRTEAETPILSLPDAKSWHIRKDSCWENWGQEKKWTSEDDMVGWHHRINGHEFLMASGSWWWTGSHVMLLFLGSQRVRHYWVSELNTYINKLFLKSAKILSKISPYNTLKTCFDNIISKQPLTYE